MIQKTKSGVNSTWLHNVYFSTPYFQLNAFKMGFKYKVLHSDWLKVYKSVCTYLLCFFQFNRITPTIHSNINFLLLTWTEIHRSMQIVYQMVSEYLVFSFSSVFFLMLLRMAERCRVIQSGRISSPWGGSRAITGQQGSRQLSSFNRQTITLC